MPRIYHSHVGAHFYTVTHTAFPQSKKMSQQFATPPPEVPEVVLSSPVRHVLLVTLDRPKQLNALRREMHYRLEKLWEWFDGEPSLRCAVITGRGRAFCAGADLKEWHSKHSDGTDAAASAAARDNPQGIEKWGNGGFGGMSNRAGKKPIIAAVNGLCLGGGMEMAVNADMILASETAQFGLPEVKRGVVAIAGALPRLTRVLSRQRASEMALLGRTYSAEDMAAWGIVNRVVRRPAEVVDEALRWAAEVAAASPDSVIVSREGLLGGWAPEDPRESTRNVEYGIYAKMDAGENMTEGVLSFVEKRKAVWKDSKL
jgi:enoyl-CoA hydratase/carnithine racemase